MQAKFRMKSSMLRLPRGNAICYSGYREGQSPDSRVYPSLEQIREDLHILKKHWQLLRLYDCSVHAERVLQVIDEDRLPLQVMLGAYLGPEMNNFGCPWGGTYSQEHLDTSRRENAAELQRLVALARRFERIVFSVAVGNEATVDWTDHYVPVPHMIDYVRQVKAQLRQPVTFCENYVPWQHKLHDLVAELDFISLHTYPGVGIQAYPRGAGLHQGQRRQRGAALSGQAHRHHRGRLVHCQQRPRHAC
jgi:exo-beta-1,3-glucanase (GH17 family)